MPVPFAFVAEPLDRGDALRDDAAAIAARWPDARVLLVDADGRSLAHADGSLSVPRGAQIGDAPGGATFLGMHGEQAWFALPLDAVGGMPPHRVDLRTAAAAWPALESTVFAQARALLHWRVRNRHCGACGGALAFRRGGWQAHCAACGSDHYPRTDPAVIVAVTDGERLLLGRQASWPPQRYSTLAGFVEPGESLEQTVAREVLEESGVRIRAGSVRYLASQPWPFPGSLMLGFIAGAEPDAPRTGDELEDARWFTRGQVGDALRGAGDGLVLSPAISISRWLVERWFGGAQPA